MLTAQGQLAQARVRREQFLAKGWAPNDDLAEPADHSTDHYVWFGPMHGDEIAVVDDFSIPVRSVAARGGTESRSAQIAEALRKTLDHVSSAELRARATAHIHDDPVALVRLALSLTSRDEVSQEILTRALSSSAESLRRLARHAVHACSATQNPSESSETPDDQGSGRKPDQG